MTRNRNLAILRVPPSSATAIRFASLLLVFITIIALAAVAYFTERGIVVSRDWVIHTYQVRSQLNDLELEIMRAEDGETSNLLMPGKEQPPQLQEQSDVARQSV